MREPPYKGNRLKSTPNVTDDTPSPFGKGLAGSRASDLLIPLRAGRIYARDLGFEVSFGAPLNLRGQLARRS